MRKLRSAALLRASGIIAARRHDHCFAALLAGLILAWALVWLLTASHLQHQAAQNPAAAQSQAMLMCAAGAPAAPAATSWS